MSMKVMKLREQGDAERHADAEPVSQSKRPEAGRYLLQVDRQTKSSYASAEAAAAAGLIIKRRYPIVQVSVYDRVQLENIPLSIGEDYVAEKPAEKPAVEKIVLEKTVTEKRPTAKVTLEKAAEKAAAEKAATEKAASEKAAAEEADAEAPAGETAAEPEQEPSA